MPPAQRGDGENPKKRDGKACDKSGIKRILSLRRKVRLPMHQNIPDFLSNKSIDFERFRSSIVAERSYMPSFGRHHDLKRQIDMLEQEFVGQLELKFVHASLNVLLRRGIENEIVYNHFRTLWVEHSDILIDVLDSRWLISACESICDHSDDPAEASSAILISLFMNSLKLAETERLITNPTEADPKIIKGRMPLFDGMTAFMPGGGDMPINLLGRLNRTLQPDTLVGLIGRELISRALSGNTVFTRLAPLQTENSWNTFLPPVPTLTPAEDPPTNSSRSISRQARIYST